MCKHKENMQTPHEAPIPDSNPQPRYWRMWSSIVPMPFPSIQFYCYFNLSSLVTLILNGKHLEKFKIPAKSMKSRKIASTCLCIWIIGLWYCICFVTRSLSWPCWWTKQLRSHTRLQTRICKSPHVFVSRVRKTEAIVTCGGYSQSRGFVFTAITRIL